MIKGSTKECRLIFLLWLFFFCSIPTPSAYGATSSLNAERREDVVGSYKPQSVESQGVAIILPGSGDPDIDGNTPPLVMSSPYKKIADGLAAKGITVFRYKKRPLKEVLAMTRATGESALAIQKSDIANKIWSVRERAGAKCVWLIGHSEGGLYALLVAQEREDICGIILAAAPLRPLGTVLREQIDKISLSPKFMSDSSLVIEGISKGAELDRSKLDPIVNILFNDEYLNALKDIINLDPAGFVKKSTVPLIYLSGENDFQISDKDFDVALSLGDIVAYKKYSGLNHYFYLSKSSSPSDAHISYMNKNAAIDDRALNDIYAFVRSH